MSKRPRYTDEFRAGCVLMMESAGYETDKAQALRIVAKSQKVPPSTLRSWWNRLHNPDGLPNAGTIPAKNYTLQKTDLLSKVRQMADRLANSITDDAIDEAGLRDRITAFAIAVDKLQLLEGKPTAIVKLQEALEQGTITPQQIRERWPALAPKVIHDNVSA